MFFEDYLSLARYHPLTKVRGFHARKPINKFAVACKPSQAVL
jgi:hypothetical protein